MYKIIIVLLDRVIEEQMKRASTVYVHVDQIPLRITVVALDFTNPANLLIRRSKKFLDAVKFDKL
jgi:threonine/homoserine efflux transporter RhtA